MSEQKKVAAHLATPWLERAESRDGEHGAQLLSSVGPAELNLSTPGTVGTLHQSAQARLMSPDRGVRLSDSLCHGAKLLAPRRLTEPRAAVPQAWGNLWVTIDTVKRLALLKGRRLPQSIPNSHVNADYTNLPAAVEGFLQHSSKGLSVVECSQPCALLTEFRHRQRQ
ncbi:hypothetical protein SKAU_G00414160 [Synaphobranchus kaupii]|uniref:Uncharacterized protein n=1 Tax=Synaphobranchus kaupii TaxID=118154 RepID=A0A9Q1E6Z6_SYNKA|nr:hypothetical protein SKAU_G00414160 [Synaphobranchus kaupii]